MLSYRHRFHAGNFADVLKHALLVRVLTLLTRKPKPLAYVDTHAGIGHYDLSHPWALKLAEHREGIGRLWQRRDVPPALAPYLHVVRACNADDVLRNYPGSPCIAARLLRADDRLVLGELNADDCAVLKGVLQQDSRAGVHHVEAATTIKAFLPPKERRGLVLVDPPFDRADELARLVDTLVVAHRRWSRGVYALWYPLMDLESMRRFERTARDCGVRRILQIELSIRPPAWRSSLRGSGMLIVNPPYGLEVEAREWLPWLWQALSPAGEGEWRVSSLVGE